MNHEPDDPVLSAAIADVEPLDELTKARLIKTAMRATEPRHRNPRWLAAAAAIVAVVLVAGGAVAVLTRDDTNREVADSSVAPTAAATGSDAAGPETVSSLPDLGSVQTTAELRDALKGAAFTREVSAADAAGTDEYAFDPSGLAESCPSPEPFPPPAIAWATVVYRGDPALVAIAVDDDVQYAYVLSPDGCTLLSRVEL